jgi:CxxC motif-containing protein (DUF1111 family)
MTKIETVRAKGTKLTKRIKLILAVAAVLLLGTFGVIQAAFLVAKDPGVRGGDPGAGKPFDKLTNYELNYFSNGKQDFEEVEDVGDGLGPRFNLDGCGGCHIHPAVGGTSPAENPQAKLADGFYNKLPPFITLNGPIREARLKFKPDGTRDGGVHNLFVVSGRGDASGCTIKQDNFAAELSRNNVIFRIPTPLFGAGLIKQIPDRAILANLGANTSQKSALGIFGRPSWITGNPNNNGNDGTIARFGWKAQNKSLLLFSGEAYNVEMGITNELFQTERDETPGGDVLSTNPNDVTDPSGGISAIEKFAFFMRFLAPPNPSPDTPGGSQSIGRGRNLFTTVGCFYCHTPMLKTGNSTVAALAGQDVNLFSDLALHQMGPGLADDILQGEARGDEFRTAPLWGVGQRIFFLHDGRTSDLVQAIRAHKSSGNSRFGPSEANGVINNFNAPPEGAKQDLLNFLRSL